MRSHPIRGVKGKNATEDDRQQNCQKAITVAKAIQLFIPELDLYVPAYVHDFDYQLLKQNIMTEEEIVDIDCDILNKRDLLIIYNWQGGLSNGMITEINFAKENNIPLFSMTQLAEFTIDGLKLLVEEIKIKKERINEYGLGE